MRTIKDFFGSWIKLLIKDWLSWKVRKLRKPISIMFKIKFTKRRTLVKRISTISQLCIFLWIRASTFIWTNLNLLHRGMLCAKFGWIRPSASEEDENVKNLWHFISVLHLFFHLCSSSVLFICVLHICILSVFFICTLHLCSSSVLFICVLHLFGWIKPEDKNI